MSQKRLLGRFVSWDVSSLGTFGPLGRLVPWTFCPKNVSCDVLSLVTFCLLGRFVPWYVWSLGRFVPWTVLSLKRFFPWDILSLEPFVPGTLCLGTFCFGTFCPMGWKIQYTEQSKDCLCLFFNTSRLPNI